MCMIMVSAQPGLIVTVLVFNRFFFGMTAFYGFGGTSPMRPGSPFVRARIPLVPLCVAPCMCATAPGGGPLGRPDDVGPEGHLSFLGRIFRACAKPRTGPVLRPSRHASQHTISESNARPGPPAGPGSFFGHCGKIWVFPSFGDSFGAPHPGMLYTVYRCVFTDC